MLIRNMIRMILNESFESDKNELAELYPDFAPQISQLGPKWIMWLSSRFGLQPKREEVHPFEDALTTILAFSKKDSAMGQKYKSSEQWRAAVDAQFPERKWATPADAMTMTVDDMETLLAMSERKKQNVDASASSINTDFLAKVGPWNLYMPTTRENSCAIAGVDKLTMKPATTWCTARTSGSNLFYSYVARRGENIVLFYLIKDAASAPNDRISIGFVNGKPQIDGQFGGVTVNAQNDGMNTQSLKSAMGSFFEPIMNILSKKSLEIAGEHPAKGKIKDAAMSLVAFADILRGLSAEEATDMKKQIVRHDEISKEVLVQLAGDADSTVRADVASNKNTPAEILKQFTRDKSANVREIIASHSNTSSETLMQLVGDRSVGVKKCVANNENAPAEALIKLAGDKNGQIRTYVASNKNTPTEILVQLARDPEMHVRSYIAQNPNTPLKTLVQLTKDEEKHVRGFVALNPKAPVEILAQLAKDKEMYVRSYVAKNHRTPPEILASFAKNEEFYILGLLARNPSTPTEVLLQLARNENVGVRTMALEQLKERNVYEAVILKILKSKR